MADEKVSKCKIKHALYHSSWKYGEDDRGVLDAHGKKVPPLEYESHMYGHVFCPACTTNLTRAPQEKDHFTNARDAHYRHLGKFKDVPCVHRTKKPDGKRYDTYEQARKAVDMENLVIVKDLLWDKPEMPERSDGEYNQTPVEEIDGELAQVPISRHEGETFPLPSKITSIRAICRRLDENLKKYYYFSGMTYAVRLDGLLHDIEDVTAEDDSPKLYFGLIESSWYTGQRRDNTIRMTRIKCSPDVNDFTLKTKLKNSDERGFDDASVGRVVLAYGKITQNGIGLCIKDVGWGGFDLLPRKYERLLGF